MNRRGQGMSVNMIIIMTLALLVLVVSIVMFIRQKDKADDVLGNCEALGGTCLAIVPDGTRETCGKDIQPYPVGSCEKGVKICCLPDKQSETAQS